MSAFDVRCNAVYVSVLAVAVALGEEEEQEKRKKGPDRSWLRRTDERGAFATIVRELSAEDTASYRSFMRMDVATFRQLAEIISPRVSKKSTVMRTPISVQHRLALTLRYLATGESFRSLEFQFRISRPAISYIVYEVSYFSSFAKQCTVGLHLFWYLRGQPSGTVVEPCELYFP